MKPNNQPNKHSTSPASAIPITYSQSLREGISPVPTLIGHLSMMRSGSAVKSFVGHTLFFIGGSILKTFFEWGPQHFLFNTMSSPLISLPPTSKPSSETCCSLSSWGSRVIGTVMIFIPKLAFVSPGGFLKTSVSGAHPHVSDSASLGWRLRIRISSKFPGDSNFRSHVLRTIGSYKQLGVQNSLTLKRAKSTLG